MEKDIIRLSVLLMGIGIAHLSYSREDSTKHAMSFKVYAISTFATRKEQPLWITSNKRGILNENSHNLVFFGSFKYARPVFKTLSLNIALEPEVRNSDAYEFGTAKSSLSFVDYFVRLNYKSFYLRLGGESRAIGQFGGKLSSGSLQQSMNARPIPGITLGADYFNIPFTKGWLQAKGEFTHGWMEKERVVRRPWYHQKYGYLKFAAKSKFNVEFGITHFALWGGETENATRNFNFGDFGRVITGGFTDPNTSNVGSNDTFVFGGHHGTIDLALNFDFKNFSGVLYAQKPWEDAEQIGWNIPRKWFGNRDGIFGLSLNSPSSIFQRITIEWIRTDFQMGPGLPDTPPANILGDGDPTGCNHNRCYEYGTRENYDNNFIFQSGKTYYQRNIGTPLYTHQKRILNTLGSDFDVVGEVYGRNTVYNNRVSGVHLGLSGKINENTSYRLKYTYTKNYGNYFAEFGRGYNSDYTDWSRTPDEPYYFENGINQSYSLVEISHQLNKIPIEVTGGLGGDFGGIYDSFGMLLKVSYHVF